MIYEDVKIFPGVRVSYEKKKEENTSYEMFSSSITAPLLWRNPFNIRRYCDNCDVVEQTKLNFCSKCIRATIRVRVYGNTSPWLAPPSEAFLSTRVELLNVIYPVTRLLRRHRIGLKVARRKSEMSNFLMYV